MTREILKNEEGVLVSREINDIPVDVESLLVERGINVRRIEAIDALIGKAEEIAPEMVQDARSKVDPRENAIVDERIAADDSIPHIGMI